MLMKKKMEMEMHERQVHEKQKRHMMEKEEEIKGLQEQDDRWKEKEALWIERYNACKKKIAIIEKKEELWTKKEQMDIEDVDGLIRILREEHGQVIEWQRLE